MSASSAGVTTALGLVADGTTQGTRHDRRPDTTRTTLQSDYNNVLTQIDTLAKDASYNGVNLLNGDNLKVVFNENGTSSSLTITGVTYDSAGLGLVVGRRHGFQDDAKIDTDDRRARHRADHPAHPGLEVRFEPDHGADPSGLHQGPDQHPADRRRQPRPRRHQRGRRQPARPADPPAAVLDRAVARPRRPTRRCCACSNFGDQADQRRGSAPPFCFWAW